MPTTEASKVIGHCIEIVGVVDGAIIGIAPVEDIGVELEVLEGEVNQ